jgi:hypothetical protein
MLLAQKMLEIEYKHHQEFIAKGHPQTKYSNNILEAKKLLFKARLIACERYVCFQAYGWKGADFKCWSDNINFTHTKAADFVCPPHLFDEWSQNTQSLHLPVSKPN